MRTGDGARISRLPKLRQNPALRLRDALPATVMRWLPDAGYDDQRRVIDRFFDARSECVIALPTGQAIMVRH